MEILTGEDFLQMAFVNRRKTYLNWKKIAENLTSKELLVHVFMGDIMSKRIARNELRKRGELPKYRKEES